MNVAAENKKKMPRNRREKKKVQYCTPKRLGTEKKTKHFQKAMRLNEER